MAAVEDAGPADNHGAEVSAIAHGDTEGREHGQAVSEVASRGQAGGGQGSTATPNGGGIGTGTEASDGANATGAAHAADRASQGSGNAGEHGKP